MTRIQGAAKPPASPGRFQIAIAALAVVCIAVHLVARYLLADWLPTTAPAVWNAPLYMALLLGGLPLLVGLLRAVSRGEFGSDLLAGISIVTSVVLGEYLAGTLVVLMLSGGLAVLEIAWRTKDRYDSHTSSDEPVGSMMFRSIVLFLMLPSLVMPPGVCICQFIAVRESTPALSSHDQPAASEPVERAHAECTCAACRSHNDAEGDDHGNGPARSEPSPFDDHRHWPCCPAATDAVPHALPLPVATVPADVCWFLARYTSVEQELTRPVLIKDQTATAHSLPRFLAHCSLLI